MVQSDYLGMNGPTEVMARASKLKQAEGGPAQLRRDALLHELRQRHAGLPRRLGDAARFLLEHPTEAALETVASLAQGAGVQPSTLVRLAQTIGLSGFSEWQAIMRAALAEAAPTYQERVRQHSADATGLLHQLCALNETSLRHLAEAPQGPVDQAAGLLTQAAMVHVIGQRRSHAAAVHLAYGLTRAGKVARVLSGAGGFLKEEAQAIRPADVMVAISVHPYSAEVIEVCAIAARRGATLIALTDGPLSPLFSAAAVTLEVHDAELWGFRSLVAQMTLVQALVIGVSAALQRPVSAR